MTVKGKSWQNLFLFCVGLSIAAGFCMKWMEGDLVQGGSVFTILGLELFYAREKVDAILTGIDPQVTTILQYHLYFDFAFMTGIFPGIAALCCMAASKVSGKLFGKILVLLAFLQLAAWGCDVYENCSLLSWIHTKKTGENFTLFHFIVTVKWVLAVTGALCAVPVCLLRKK